MANIKGVYKKVSLQQILNKLENIKDNTYAEIDIELDEENLENYIFENNDKLTIFLAKEELKKEESKRLVREIINKVEEYNKKIKGKPVQGKTYNNNNNNSYYQNEQDDLDEYILQFKRVKDKLKGCKTRGEYIEVEFSEVAYYKGMPIKGKYIIINGTELDISKIRGSRDFDWLINEYIPRVNKEIKDKESNRPLSKMKQFKDSLKYNMEKISEENKPKIEKRKKHIKRKLKNAAKKIDKACVYILDKYNNINRETRKRVIAIILSAVALHSAGSIGYDVGRATEHVEGQGYETIDDAIDDLQKKRTEEIEKYIEADIGKDVEVTAEQRTDHRGETFVNTGVKSGYTRYSIPNEMEEMLEDIAIEAQSGFGKKMKLAKLLKLEGEIEGYFSNKKLTEKERSIMNDKLVAKRNGFER